jgi:CRISPR-associated protein, csn1 family
MTQKYSYSPKKYSLGLDIGTSSIGWAVLDLDKERIHDLGVRIFERPEDPQNGDSLAKPRRDARSARRRLKRRRQRLNNLKQFFIDQNILTRDRIEEVLSDKSEFNKLDVYALRSKALTEELSPEELLKVMHQIAKRRGFKSNRKIEEESEKEGGRVSKALKTNEKFLAENGYKTVGEALSRDENFASHKRNKRDDYTNSFSRGDFLHELEKIIEVQKRYALKNVSDTAINEMLYGLDNDKNVVNISAIMYQRPFMTEELIKKMVGNCTFEENEKRAPRASYSFEIFRLASDLSHLIFIPRDASKRQAKRENLEIRLSSEQINRVIEAAKNQKSLTYKKVRSIAGISEDYVPKYTRGKKKDGDEFGEGNAFGGLKAYYDIKTALKNLPEDWSKIDNESMINQIAYILTTQKSDEGIKAELNALPISDDARNAIVKIKATNFGSFCHLSIKALQKITPHILNGMTYDKACEAAGYDFKKQSASLEQITNPVVKRAISQTLKVVRAIERKYSKPYFIKVETARDLAKNFKERNAIKKENEENQGYNEDIKSIIADGYEASPKTKGGKQLLSHLKELNVPLNKNADFNGQQIIKIKLYREQNGICPYSGKPIDFDTMLQDDNAYQIDHIVPFSRSNNDGITNKVLVLTEENQKKSNKTPFEYFGADENRWKEFVARVESIYKTRDIKTDDKATNAINYKYNGYAMKKKQNLLLQDYKNDSWNVRALNDTRYITRFIQNYLRQNVDFAGDKGKQHVIAPNGTTTAYLRKRWGLAKDRSEDVLHHAKDAAVVAAIDQKIIMQANLHAKRHEIKELLAAAKTMEEKTDKLTGEIIDEDEFSKAQRRKNAMLVLSSKHFPQPWDGFGKEVMKRTLNVDVKTLQNELRGLDNYDEEFRLSVKPIFVSREIRHKIRGEAHESKLRSNRNRNGQNLIRIPLTELTLQRLENSLAKEEFDSQKNKNGSSLYEKLLARLNECNGDAKKAFNPPFKLYKGPKQDKNGNPISPVAAVKVYEKKGVVSVGRKANAPVALAEMVRIRVYKKDNQIYMIPGYRINILENKEPMELLKPLKEVSKIDNSFNFIGYLYKGDLITIQKDSQTFVGYFVQFEGDNRITIKSHLAADSSRNSKSTVKRESLSGINYLKIHKVDVLGDVHFSKGVVWPGAS